MDFTPNSSLLDSENRVWWGSGKGLSMLDLNKYTLANRPPLVNLRQLDINEQFIDYRQITDGLNNEDIAPAYILLDLDEYFAIRKASDINISKRCLQIRCDICCQPGVRISCKYFHHI